jgi:integrase
MKRILPLSDTFWISGRPIANKRLDEATEESKEKGILTSAELFSLIDLPIKDPYSRLAVLLAARCGMRRGEIRGLQWGDINKGMLGVVISSS